MEAKYKKLYQWYSTHNKRRNTKTSNSDTQLIIREAYNTPTTRYIFNLLDWQN